jgi:CubicO group peptidase (beta-lactamase class C family)
MGRIDHLDRPDQPIDRTLSLDPLRTIMSRLIRPFLGALVATLTTASLGQSLSPTEISLQSLRGRPLAIWSQAEREFGFANWDRAFPARKIARGQQVHPLAAGAPWLAFAPGGEGALQLQRNIDEFNLAGIVVLHKDKLRLERYAPNHSAAGRWVSFSLAKSLTSTLAGAAIKDGFIASVDDAVTRYIPELRDSAYDSVTVRQLLTMTSGAKWNEDYKDPAADVALFYAMPIDLGMDATVSYMRKLRRDAPPGQRWHYNTGDTNLVGVLVARATKKDLATYASEKIWARYGMESDASWMLDRTGHEHGGCCLQATTRDFARFGQFILDGARIDGQSIVPDGWLEAATRKQVDIGQPGFGYGYQWWTRDNGTFNAYGIHGQQIHVDPARGLVIAINSAAPEANFTRELIAARIALFDVIRAAIDAEQPRALPKP